MQALKPIPPAAEREIVSWRVIDAPRRRVFEAYRDAAQLRRWWGPNGFTNTFEVFQFETGGEWKFVMHGPDGTNYKNESRFTLIIPDSRIEFEHAAPHFHATHTLEDEGADKTRLTWRMAFSGDAAFNSVKGFAPRCNEENFDKLSALLADTAERNHF